MRSFYLSHPIDYPTSVENALLQVEQKAEKNRKRVREHAEAFAAAEALMPLWTGTGEHGFYYSIPSSGSLGGILFRIGLKGQDRMEDISPILEWLTDNGWKVGDGDDYPEIHRRNFVCTKGKATINVMVFADSEVCRVIEDGVKTEPNFKIVCGDSA